MRSIICIPVRHHRHQNCRPHATPTHRAVCVMRYIFEASFACFTHTKARIACARLFVRIPHTYTFKSLTWFAVKPISPPCSRRLHNMHVHTCILHSCLFRRYAKRGAGNVCRARDSVILCVVGSCRLHCAWNACAHVVFVSFETRGACITCISACVRACVCALFRLVRLKIDSPNGAIVRLRGCCSHMFFMYIYRACNVRRHEYAPVGRPRNANAPKHICMHTWKRYVTLMSI